MSRYTPAIITPELASLPCPSCGSIVWVYSVTHSTILGAGHRYEACDELRCMKCAKKASKTLTEMIRQTPEFKRARQVEVDKEAHVS